MRADVGSHLCPVAFAALEHALADGLQPLAAAA